MELHICVTIDCCDSVELAANCCNNPLPLYDTLKQRNLILEICLILNAFTVKSQDTIDALDNQ